MRVLFVTPYLPVPPDFGGAIRIYSLARQVVREHEVTVVSLAGQGDDPSLTETALGRTVAVVVPWTGRQRPGPRKRLSQLRSLLSLHSAQYRQMVQPALQMAIDRLMREEQFDVVQCEFSLTGLYRFAPHIPVVLDVHNLEHDLVRQVSRTGTLARRWFNALEWRKLAREEVTAWRRARVCLATSADDAETIRRVTGGQVAVVPNGVDLDLVRPLPIERGRPEQVLFVGTLRYRPNAEAVEFFVGEVLPRLRARVPGVEFIAVGSDPPPHLLELARQPGVTVLGRVADTRPWLEQSGIVVVPLLTGSGTRLKILEAFAAGRPVVSTTLGAAGLEVEDGVHLLLADSAEAMASAIERLIRSPGLRQELVTRARELVERRYEWKLIGQRLLTVYEGLRTTAR